MKIITTLLIATAFFSCTKTDKINHYLIKPITQQELIDNGFYKYSYTYKIEDKDGIKDTVASFVEYELYSNVKPEIDNNGRIHPLQFLNMREMDSIERKKRFEYRQKDLNDRIITYLFRNDSLLFKDIRVFSRDYPKKEIADLSTEEKIIRYYDSIQIPIKPVFQVKTSTKEYPTIFMIDNHKVRLYYSEKDKSYDMFVNYLSDNHYFDILVEWYAGKKMYRPY
ncbi:hypothetical protein ACFFLS_07145 [Flavobacterium procerum]|uniref:Lipoprotein n=1 Tax=Flavobacterium procerum TaxID=1455569 RepID=A0ABV6BMY8_9FLAO